LYNPQVRFPQQVRCHPWFPQYQIGRHIITVNLQVRLSRLLFLIDFFVIV